MSRALSFDDYTVAWIAVLPIEAEAAIYARTHNTTAISNASAAALGSHIKARFPNLWFALLVGIAAGLPNLSPTDPSRHRDIRLGDVLVCVPNKRETGIIAYDQGRETDEGFFLDGRQVDTPAIVRAAISNIKLTKPSPFRSGTAFSIYLRELQAQCSKFGYPRTKQDLLFDGKPGRGRIMQRDPWRTPKTQVWYGSIGSGNSLMRDARRRNHLRDTYDLIGLEMEAAGIMSILPTGVIRGVCDYGDAYKNKDWQPYAAATAAAYAKGLLYTINLKRDKESETAPPETIQYRYGGVELESGTATTTYSQDDPIASAPRNSTAGWEQISLDESNSAADCFRLKYLAGKPIRSMEDLL
ncbi:hypothetical protein BDW59DRAFT_161415 [Aspergillus cavernicola]|uniref:Nucleoside phosphorylase domain-containing protein n=1 Tax=Aspergillus cavernicola TaxID=176166 RepID=A0ABR4IDC5_9EURO